MFRTADSNLGLGPWVEKAAEMLSSRIYEESLLSLKLEDDIYDALKDDAAEVVMKILRTMSEKPFMVSLGHDVNHKSEVLSTRKRNEGNNAYKCGYYQRALVLYNEALLYAPKGTRELKLAYSNRSALFAHLKAWTACHNDINRCFAMGCPSDIEEKLIKRQNEAQSNLTSENFFKSMTTQGAANLVNCSIPRHSQIPSVSSNIKIVNSTVTAATDIKVGAVIASEQAYVSHTSLNNMLFSCHYCQKKELNLIPCDGCCYALFCDEECKSNCMNEFHEYECKIMSFRKQYGNGEALIHLMIKACLKVRKSCKSWEEFIKVSHSLGSSRIQSSSIQEIYDTNNKYSVLCFRDDRTFIYGALFNTSFIVADWLHYLENKFSSFLPKNSAQKHQAMQAMARIMMGIAVYQKPLPIVQGHNTIHSKEFAHGLENYGLYSFLSKLTNMCDPNTVIINNNNELILIAVRPIKSGEEISVPFFWWHRHDDIDIEKNLQNPIIFKSYGTVCGCFKCTNNPQTEHDEEPLTKNQKKYFSQLKLRDLENRIDRLEINHVYKTLSKALEVLKDVPNSKEYIKVYKLWRQCLFFYEVTSGDNHVLANVC